jgi:hypothetical protein
MGRRHPCVVVVTVVAVRFGIASSSAASERDRDSGKKSTQHILLIFGFYRR